MDEFLDVNDDVIELSLIDSDSHRSGDPQDRTLTFV